MDNWEVELHRVTNMLKLRLQILKDSGMTYIPKKLEGKMEQSIIEPSISAQNLEDLRNQIGDCQKCGLAKHRTNLVFGEGSKNADVVFVGEAPGASEDDQGRPFVGRSGQLLTKMIEAMGFQRSDVYICNVVKCRPPSNRDPEPAEIDSCEIFLQEQLKLIEPKIIVGLGRYACQTLLRSKVAMSKIRGLWHEYNGIKFMPTFHPAYLLRNPPAKKFVWQDLQAVMAELKDEDNS